MLNLETNSSKESLNYVYQRTVNIYKNQRKSSDIISFRKWIDKYYRIPLSNRAPQGTLVFSDKPYLKDLYKCTDKEIVVMKSAQVGISEWAIAQSIYHADQYGAIVLYTFPTAAQIGNFVSGRVNPVIENSMYINQLIGKSRYSKDDIGMKSIGGAFLYFRGSVDRNQIISINADMVVLDELDQMIQNSIDTIEKRLLSSAYQWKRKLSAPTYVDFGIDAEYAKSDMRQWFIKCPKCRKEQTLRFPQSFRIDPPQDGYWCDKHKCDGKLNPTKGMWIKTVPESDITGYHVVGMMNPRTNALKIIEKYNDPRTNIMEFYWQDIGIPYNPKGSKMTRDILDACRATDKEVLAEIGNHCRMGVDVGKVLHVRISELVDERKVARYIGTVKEFEDLDKLMRLYDVDVCIIDALPETRKAKEFQERYKGRVWLAYYTPIKGGRICDFDPKEPIVKVNRTLALDHVHAELEGREQVLPKNIDDIEDFYDQMCALTKIEKTDPKTGNKSYLYVGGSVDEQGKPTTVERPDHYMHSSVYEFIAWQAKVYRTFTGRRARIFG
jgi:hypothetical protein